MCDASCDHTPSAKKYYILYWDPCRQKIRPAAVSVHGVTLTQAEYGLTQRTECGKGRGKSADRNRLPLPDTSTSGRIRARASNKTQNVCTSYNCDVVWPGQATTGCSSSVVQSVCLIYLFIFFMIFIFLFGMLMVGQSIQFIVIYNIRNSRLCNDNQKNYFTK